MKPLPKRAGPSADSVRTVAMLAAALDRISEPLTLAALDDQTLAPIASALTAAADVAGRWLATHDQEPFEIARTPSQRCTPRSPTPPRPETPTRVGPEPGDCVPAEQTDTWSLFR